MVSKSRKKRNSFQIISILIGILSVFIIIWICYIKETIPNLINLKNDLNPLKFDYIIVGAGTAGSVVASILSGNNKNQKILLIEAGHTFSWTTKIPLLATFSQKSETDWNFLTIPQKYSSNGIINKQQCLPRGKGLGGSSQINYLLHFNGNHKDFDNWEKIGLKNWNYESIKSFLENDPNNPMTIWKIPKNYSLLSEAFDNLKTEFQNEHLNFHFSQYTIRNGLRSNAYQIYLQPNLNNKNLKILTKSIVNKINFNNNNKAISIILNNNVEIFAKNEIILSSGCYQTPQILQRSGIASKNILDKFNIKKIYESSNVGENLHDHMNLPLYVSIEKIASITVNKILNPFEIWKYLRTGQGHFGNFGVIGNIDTKNDTFGISIFGTGSINEKALMDLSNFQLNAFRELFPLYHNDSQEGFVILSTCYQPKSRGNVIIKNLNPYIKPDINPNYLQSYDDILCMIRGIRIAIKIVQSNSFKFLKPKIHWPKFYECKEFHPIDNQSINDQYLECLIRHVGLGSHHPGGTCSMGDENSKSPLDEQLRVRGVKGLRVIDASILPTPLSGTPNSVLIGLARKGSKLILDEMN